MLERLEVVLRGCVGESALNGDRIIIISIIIIIIIIFIRTKCTNTDTIYNENKLASS